MRVVGTAGHVDHGKSTLLRALTGMEPDRWDEERRRGLTIDLGFVWTRLDGPGGEELTVAFVDVPGHERFIGNMLAGAGSVPHCMFVVAADDGWSAQSQEHLDVLDLLGVRGAVVAVTKADAVPTARVEEVVEDVQARLDGTSLETAPVLAVDGVSGTGLPALRQVLTDRLGRSPSAPDLGRPRLWIDRAFAVAGAGTVVTGTLTGGRLATDDEVAVVPGWRRARVRSLQSLGERVGSAEPGSRVALNLVGLGHDEVARGDAVVAAAHGAPREAWIETREIDVWLRALPDHEIGRRGAWHLHVGSAETLAEIRPLLDAPARPDSPCLARIRLDRALPLVTGDRVVIRDAGRRATAGGGLVLDPDPQPVRGVDARLRLASALEELVDTEDVGRRIQALVAAAGGARPRTGTLAAAGVPPSTPDPDGIAAVGTHLVAEPVLADWRRELGRVAAAEHEENPSTRGLTKDELTGAARRAGCPPALAAELVDHLVGAGQLARSGSRYLLPQHTGARDAAAEARRERLLQLLDEEPFAPPPLEDVAGAAGVDHEELNRLVHTGEVVVCGSVAFSRSAVDEAVRRLRELEEEGGPFTTAEARRALGTTRKYVIPLLEHLDGHGVTVFDGNTRRLAATGS